MHRTINVGRRDHPAVENCRGSSQHATILVVEDDEETRCVLTDVLADKAGRTITAVASGAAALAYLDTGRADLVILDIKMTDLDGIALYEYIRARDDDVAAVPVLFISAASRTSTETLAGSFRWLSKPFKLDDLDAAVDELLGN